MTGQVYKNRGQGGGRGRPLRRSVAELYPVDGCTLGAQRATMCTGEVCARCGWNQDEMTRRQKVMRNGGLTPDPETGLNRLVVTKRSAL